LLDPAAERNQGFLDEWLRFYEDRSDFSGTTKYLIVDPANTEKKTSDYTAMAVIGLGVDQKYYLLDAIRDRLSLTERGDRLFAVHRRWRPRVVGYEKYGMQADIEYFKERMRQQNYRFEIIELGGHLAKNDRIRRMIPIFEECRFYLPYAFAN
jgi:phage terminase large subunit-like protein